MWRGIYIPNTVHSTNPPPPKLLTGFDRWSGWTKTIKHMQVLLFFGQGVKIAKWKNINTGQQQALVISELWFLQSAEFQFVVFLFCFLQFTNKLAAL